MGFDPDAVIHVAERGAAVDADEVPPDADLANIFELDTATGVGDDRIARAGCTDHHERRAFEQLDTAPSVSKGSAGNRGADDVVHDPISAAATDDDSVPGVAADDVRRISTDHVVRRLDDRNSSRADTGRRRAVGRRANQVAVDVVTSRGRSDEYEARSAGIAR